MPSISDLDVYCARCANSAISESRSGFLPIRHTKWSFIATVSLATLHQHLSLLKNKVMHNSIPKWPLFDHFDHKMTAFHYMQMLSALYPFWLPIWLPLLAYIHYQSHTMQYPLIPLSPTLPFPRYCKVCMHVQCLLCTKMLKMLQIQRWLCNSICLLILTIANKKTNSKTTTRLAKTT